MGRRVPGGALVMLPSEFADLEPFAAKWCLATENERYTERLNSTMAEMQALYDAFLPVAPDAIKFVDQYSLDDMPEQPLNLLRLIYSFILVSYPVELWRQPRVPDTGATDFVRLSEPLP